MKYQRVKKYIVLSGSLQLRDDKDEINNLYTAFFFIMLSTVARSRLQIDKFVNYM